VRTAKRLMKREREGGREKMKIWIKKNMFE
jgi:hypothetical protein